MLVPSDSGPAEAFVDLNGELVSAQLLLDIQADLDKLPQVRTGPDPNADPHGKKAAEYATANLIGFAAIGAIIGNGGNRAAVGAGIGAAVAILLGRVTV